MKSVLLSLSPYWYYLEAEGIKTIEVRKNKTKSKDWNRDVYCYMTKDMKSFNMIPDEFKDKYRPHMGKVGLKFVCDKITAYQCSAHLVGEEYDWSITTEDLNRTCLSFDQFDKYGEGTSDGSLYGWHISELKIYDTPKELWEFKTGCKYCKHKGTLPCLRSCTGIEVTRPPQSWQFIKEN